MCLIVCSVSGSHSKQNPSPCLQRADSLMWETDTSYITKNHINTSKVAEVMSANRESQAAKSAGSRSWT